MFVQEDAIALEHSKVIVQDLFGCLRSGGMSVETLKHPHDCFARGQLYSDRRK